MTAAPTELELRLEPSVGRARLVLHQAPRGRGYRVNVDALHLARFAAPRVRGTLVDLGAGNGAVGLATALLAPARPRRVVLVERDSGAAALAEANARANAVAAEVLALDVAAAARVLRGVAGAVVCNPPYFEPGRGRTRKEDAVAPGARVGALAAFADAARTILGRRGRTFFVYPAADLARVLEIFAERGLVAKRARFVHGRASDPARLVLVELCAGKSGGLVIEPALVG